MSKSVGLGACPTCGRRLDPTKPVLKLPNLPPWLDRAVGNWLKGKSARDIAIYLACVPILIAFPVLALAMFGIRFYRGPSREVAKYWAPVLVASGINLWISVWLLAQLGSLLWGLSWDGIRSILFFWENMIPNMVPAPEDPQLIPV